MHHWVPDESIFTIPPEPRHPWDFESNIFFFNIGPLAKHPSQLALINNLKVLQFSCMTQYMYRLSIITSADYISSLIAV